MPSSTIIVNGQLGLVPPRQLLAAAGKYFVCTNPTPGTAIAYGLQAAYSATANGLFSISNNNASGGANIHLDYLTLNMSGTAPATTTVQRLEVYNETGISAITSLASARTPVNVNGSVSNTTGAIITSFAAGAGTVPAAVGTRRLVALAQIPTSLGITGDQYLYQFGPPDLPGSGPLAVVVRATVPTRLSTHVAPVTIAPQNTAFINLWWLTATTTAPSFEWELTYSEV